jgi:hyperosmotically inducible protein
MIFRKSTALLGGMGLLFIAQIASAQSTDRRETSAQARTATTPNDNSKSNKVDPTNTQMTADEQKNDSNDLTLAQQIRKNIMADKNLSTYAHNVKVVAVGGTVTLNGVVRNAGEKTRLSAIAMQVAGKDRVVDELKIAQPKS